MAIITSLSAENLKEVTRKARNQAITIAVDVAEIANNRFIKDLTIIKIALGTASIPPLEETSKSRMVFTVETTLAKK